MNRPVLLLLLAMLVSCTSAVDLGKSREIKSRDMYSIYNSLLEQYAIDSKVRTMSIVRTTEATSERDMECLARTSDNEQFQSAVASYGRNNQIEHELLSAFELSFAYELADVLEQVGGARPPPAGQSHEAFLREQLDTLQRRIDEGYTQIQMSAPGVSADGSVAIVYVRVSFAGEFYTLHKLDNRWSFERELRCGWIS